MKEQELEILKLESGELVIKKLNDSIGEIMFYDGSFRMALNPMIWAKMKDLIMDYLDEEMKKEKVRLENISQQKQDSVM